MQKEKAKRFLASSLLNLMGQKPYEKINISEICSAAFLSRPSFYKYFSSKDELLRYQFNTLLSAEFDHAYGDAAARLAISLVRLAGYAHIISEQRLLGLLLLELAKMLEPESPTERSMFNACYLYLSLLFAVRNAPGLRPDVTMRYWRSAAIEAPVFANITSTKYTDAVSGRNSRLISDALMAQLESGAILAQIQVRDLTSAADVNRSSFYRCYANIMDLFMQCLRALIFGELTSEHSDDASVLAHYRPYRALITAAWRELGIERFFALYVAILNEVTALPDDDIPDDQLYIYRLKNACFAAGRTALLYCFL